MTRTKLYIAIFAGLLSAAMITQPSRAQDLSFGTAAPESSLIATARSTTSVPPTQNWMQSDVGGAWAAGYTGKGTSITVVDDFSSASRFSGNFGLGRQTQRHGEWTFQEAHMIAPSATMAKQDFNSGKSVKLAKKRLNILNLSYGMYGRAGYSANQIRWSAQETSLINYARNGQAVIAKAAGNDGVAVDHATRAGTQDYLDLALVGAQSAIFVGALTTNGSTAAPASLASYSNFAGTNTTVQSQFLVVGVEANETGLSGTSFAAPIVSGYAAILGSKFTAATPTQITNRLLETARQDTLRNYDPSVYGQGEASLSRALAPISIN
jgi:subtilisin family serine protease